MRDTVGPFSNLRCDVQSGVMPEERPISFDEACALRLLLFGDTTRSFSYGWTEQSFHFRSVPSYGFIQKRAGPCGVLAAVQASVVRELLFGDSPIDASSGILRLAPCQKEEALARAITSILWQAGNSKRATVAVKRNNTVLNSDTSDILPVDGTLEYLHLKRFKCQACLLEYFLNFIPEMMEDDNASCILFLYSLLFSRGIRNIKREMDYPESNLIGDDGYCSLEIVNLILTGKAVANLFDGTLELNSGGTEISVHRGIPKKSKIGLLSLCDYHETCPVGNNYKYPTFPIWLLLGESHFTILFSTSREILRRSSKDSFTLYHYDGLARRHAEMALFINPVAYSSAPSKDGTLPIIVRCIHTKWPQASVELVSNEFLV